MAKEKYNPVPATFIITEKEKAALKDCNNQQLLLYNNTNWVYSQRWECNIVLLQTLTYYHAADYHNMQYKNLTEEINKGHITRKPYSVLAVQTEQSSNIVIWGWTVA